MRERCSSGSPFGDCRRELHGKSLGCFTDFWIPPRRNAARAFPGIYRRDWQPKRSGRLGERTMLCAAKGSHNFVRESVFRFHAHRYLRKSEGQRKRNLPFFVNDGICKESHNPGMAARHQWLAKYFTQRGAKARFARRIGEAPARVTEIIDGKRQVQLSEFPALVEETGLPPAELFEQLTSQRFPASKAALIGSVGAGAQIYPITDFGRGDGLEEVAALQGFPRAVAVRVKGDSMYPSYKNGDLIYFEKRDGIAPNALNEECVVVLGDGRWFIKVLRQSPADRRLFDLESYNQSPIEAQKVNWASPVLGVIRATALPKTM